jgi:hypothetical protein
MLSPSRRKALSMIAKGVCKREQEMAKRMKRTPSCRTHRDTVVCADLPMNRVALRDDEQTPTKIDLIGPAASAGRFILALGLEREGQARTVYGEASLSAVDDSLKLDALSLSADSERLLALAKIDRATFLAAASSASYRPRTSVDARIRSLRALIADGLAPLPIDPLPNVQARIVSARASAGGILVEAELH